MKIKKKDLLVYIATGLFLIFCVSLIVLGKAPGEILLVTYWEYTKFILLIMPAVFILVGLFNVWVKQETVEKHLGENSGFKGFLIAIGLAFACIGGLFAALPIARQLYDKGTRLSIILTYLGACSVCRVPMILFEASLLGWKFTLVRYAVSLPLIIISAVILERLLKHSSIADYIEEND